jgi:hypothetical protein
MLEREALLATDGNKYNKVFVFAPETSGLIKVQRAPWSINQLKLNTPLEISQAEIPSYAMAAAGM